MSRLALRPARPWTISTTTTRPPVMGDTSNVNRAADTQPDTPRQAWPLRLLARAWAAWAEFWHAPIRVERLALLRILLGLALLTDLFLQHLPNFGELYGPLGGVPAGLQD